MDPEQMEGEQNSDNNCENVRNLCLIISLWKEVTVIFRKCAKMVKHNHNVFMGRRSPATPPKNQSPALIVTTRRRKKQQAHRVKTYEYEFRCWSWSMPRRSCRRKCCRVFLTVDYEL